MKTALLAACLAFTALPAAAHANGINCVGAERLEDDVFNIAFAPGRSEVTPAARSLLAAAADIALAQPEREVCVLGFAGREGGATVTTTLAATRAGAVSRALAERGVAADRIRAEARGAHFSPTARAGMTAPRSVSIVVMPVLQPQR